MTSKEKAQLISILNSKIVSVKVDIEELQELIKPIPLDASIGRISRMDAINNRTINESSLREKKKILQRCQKRLAGSCDQDFGPCQKCGNEIPFGRLEYMPHVTRCVDCVG